MSILRDDGPSEAVPRLRALLGQHGVPTELIDPVLAALDEFATPPTTRLTDPEIAFAVSAGIPTTAFTTDAERESATHLALQEASAARDLLSTSGVAELLHMNVANVRRMLARGDLITAGQMQRQSAYPRWQFTDDNRVLPGLRTVLAAFPTDFHPDDIEHVMTSPADSLGDRSPRAWLESGGATDPVLSLVEDLAYT